METYEKRVYVTANGCHESYMDAAVIQKYFEEKTGYMLTEHWEDAEIIFVLGCSVTQPKENQTRELITFFEKNSKNAARILVSGCIRKVRPEFSTKSEEYSELIEETENILRLNRDAPKIRVNFPYRRYRDRDSALDCVTSAMRAENASEHTSAFMDLPLPRNTSLLNILSRIFSKYAEIVVCKLDVWGENTYSVKISTGCLGACAYCSIKQARGKIASRPVDTIVSEIRDGLKLGYREFALLGTDIGDYGVDLNTSLADLLNAITSLPQDFSVRLRNISPRYLIPNAAAFCEILRRNKITYLESPIQSGSERILKLMNRGYTAKEYLDAMRMIRDSSPKAFIRTQVIVGFPGESEADFRRSQALYDLGLFSYIDVFPYTNRPNTAASTMEGQLPESVIQGRRRKLWFKSLFQLAPKQLFLESVRRKNFSIAPLGIMGDVVNL